MANAPPFTFEEARGVGLSLSSVQRRMLLDLGSWSPDEATAYNCGELVWKDLIYRNSWSPAYRYTDRGLAAKAALEMMALSDTDLIALYHTTNGFSLEAVAALREIEDRWLDL